MTNTVSTLEMTREEWLKDRQKGIGGSDVGIILGLNKYKSAYQLWLEKTGQVELEESESEPAYWGNVLEEVVAKEFSLRTGLKVRRRNQVFSHPLHPFLRANIDRDIVGENAILECKTANSFLIKDWEGDEIPASYLCQIQHYMNVLDREYAYVAVLVGGQKFIIKKVERDQQLIDIITEQMVEFWEKNVLQEIAPPIDGSKATQDFLKNQYKDVEQNEIVLGSKFDELIESKKQLKDSKKTIEQEIRKLDNEIVQELGKNDASFGITPKYLISWKPQQRKSISLKLLAEKYPDVAKDDSIYNISEYRTLKEKEIK